LQFCLSFFTFAKIAAALVKKVDAKELEQWLLGDVIEEWLLGDVIQQWLLGDVIEQWWLGNVIEEWLLGDVIQQWLLGDVTKQWQSGVVIDCHDQCYTTWHVELWCGETHCNMM